MVHLKTRGEFAGHGETWTSACSVNELNSQFGKLGSFFFPENYIRSWAAQLEGDWLLDFLRAIAYFSLKYVKY